MLGDKTEHFQGEEKSPEDVASHVESYLQADGFIVQRSAPSDKGIVLQAKKHGWYREVIDADRAMTISISGSTDDLTVRVGIGKWLEHLGIAAVETLLISELFLVVDVADGAWTLEVENKMLKDLRTFVG